MSSRFGLGPLATGVSQQAYATKFGSGTVGLFVESNAHAYSQIKRVKPNLVILCMRLEDTDGFQVLSMLKLDDDTRGIPVLTYTSEYDVQNQQDTGSLSADLQ